MNERLRQDHEENRRREREEHLRQREQGGKRFGKMDKETQRRILTQKDLRHQSKILRDHGLVMGHVNDRFLS